MPFFRPQICFVSYLLCLFRCDHWIWCDIHINVHLICLSITKSICKHKGFNFVNIKPCTIRNITSSNLTNQVLSSMPTLCSLQLNYRTLMASVFDLEFQGKSWQNCMGIPSWKDGPPVVWVRVHPILLNSNTLLFWFLIFTRFVQLYCGFHYNVCSIKSIGHKSFHLL